ncbi:CLUMA_CG014629, isoform A [Clunio marinus]|uniref:CLUMA_CG014629, isoform A n=1 Tax=Clunio marinus TaxID=568069 RepID=A0A1J1IMJ8_9DIPT|nr:CLUMA_CG014629, isoform A [Clunio marinus]
MHKNIGLWLGEFKEIFEEMAEAEKPHNNFITILKIISLPNWIAKRFSGYFYLYRACVVYKIIGKTDMCT